MLFILSLIYPTVPETRPIPDGYKYRYKILPARFRSYRYTIEFQILSWAGIYSTHILPHPLPYTVRGLDGPCRGESLSTASWPSSSFPRPAAIVADRWMQARSGRTGRIGCCRLHVMWGRALRFFSFIPPNSILGWRLERERDQCHGTHHGLHWTRFSQARSKLEFDDQFDWEDHSWWSRGGGRRDQVAVSSGWILASYWASMSREIVVQIPRSIPLSPSILLQPLERE